MRTRRLIVSAVILSGLVVGIGMSTIVGRFTGLEIMAHWWGDPGMAINTAIALVLGGCSGVCMGTAHLMCPMIQIGDRK